MVKVEKNYLFEAPGGELSSRTFSRAAGNSWSYHFMFDPAWEKGCPGCTSYANAIGGSQHAQQMRHHLCHGVARAAGQARGLQGTARMDHSVVLVVRQRFQLRLSCHHDEKVAPIEYNYRNKAELETAKVPTRFRVKEHGLSVFFNIGEAVFHTYSAYARGTEALTDSRALLDMTPYGRQQDFEDSPPDWPQKPTYG